MINADIIELTVEQEDLIPQYLNKWRNKVFTTKPMDKQKAAAAVIKAYQFLGCPVVPEIIFVPSPYGAMQWIIEQTQSLLNSQDEWAIDDFFREQSYLFVMFAELCPKNLNHFLSLYQQHKINLEIEQELINRRLVFNGLLSKLRKRCAKQIKAIPDKKTRQLIRRNFSFNFQPEKESIYLAQLDFAIAQLDYTCPPTQWELCQEIVTECGWIYPLEKVCLICDRPKKITFDQDNRLHGEGKPAILYRDGFKIYAYHGTLLPRKYGQLHPEQWRAKWLLEEKNVELKRALIQGIGYGKICQELQAKEIDTWREYTLLFIKQDVDLEPIYLLKMVCPSTNYIHVLRVPPTMTSAREASRWVNWDIDPEDFSIQT